MASNVGGVGGDLVGDDAVAHVLFVGKPEVLLGSDVAKHGGAVPSDQDGADGAGDVVVSRRDIGGQRSQGIERSFRTQLDFLFHLLLDLVQWDVAGAFD